MTIKKCTSNEVHFCLCVEIGFLEGEREREPFFRKRFPLVFLLYVYFHLHV